MLNYCICILRHSCHPLYLIVYVNWTAVVRASCSNIHLLACMSSCWCRFPCLHLAIPEMWCWSGGVSECECRAAVAEFEDARIAALQDKRACRKQAVLFVPERGLVRHALAPAHQELGFTATWRHIHSQQSVGFDGAVHSSFLMAHQHKKAV